MRRGRDINKETDGNYITPFTCIKSRDKLVAKVFVVYPCNNSQQQYRIAHAWYFTYYTTYFFLNFPENVHITKWCRVCWMMAMEFLVWSFFCGVLGQPLTFAPFCEKKESLLYRSTDKNVDMQYLLYRVHILEA